jgi:hypothetical protein
MKVASEKNSEELIFLETNSKDISTVIEAMAQILRVDRTTEGIQDALKTLFSTSPIALVKALIIHRVGSALFVLSGAKNSSEFWMSDVQGRLLYNILVNYYSCSQKRIQIAREAAKRSIEALNVVGIKPLILKGITLAELLHHDPAMRTFGDIDLIISQDEYLRAYNAMSIFQKCSETSISSCFAVNPDAKEDLRINIDLQSCGKVKYRSITQKILGFNHQDEVAKTYSRSIPTDSSIGSIRTISESTLLQYLCTHYMEHFVGGSASLSGLCDIAFLIHKYHTTLDWDEIIISSKGNLIYPPLLLSSRWLGAEIPEEILKKVRTKSNRAVQKRVEKVVDNFDSAIFGYHDQKYLPSQWSSRIRLISLALFPSADHLEARGLLDANSNIVMAYLRWFKHLWNTYHIR